MSKSLKGLMFKQLQRGDAGQGALLYLLDAVFSAMADQAAPLPSVLPVRVGYLKVTQDASNDFSVVGGKLYRAHMATWGNAWAGASNSAGVMIAFQRPGITLRVQEIALSGVIGFSGSASSAAQLAQGAAGTGGEAFYSGKVYLNASPILMSGPENVVILLRKTGAYFFKMDGTLLWVSSANSVAEYFMASRDAVGAVASRLSVLRLPGAVADAVPGNGVDVADSKDLDTWASIATPAAGNTFTHAPDFVLKAGVTHLASAGAIGIRFRYVSATAHWYAYINAAGDFYLYEYPGPAQRGLSAASVSNGSTISIVACGETIKCFVDGVLKITYAAASAYKTATNGSVHTMGTDAVLANLTAKTLNGIGQAVAPTVVTDYGANALHGVATAVGLVGAASEGGRYNGLSYTNIYSSLFNSKFNGQEHSVIQRAKCPTSVWIDSTTRKTIGLLVDGSNLSYIRRSTTNNRLEFHYIAGGVTAIVVKTPISDINWMTLGFSASKSANSGNGEFKAFYNGAQEGATQTGLGTWTGNLLSTGNGIGANSTAFSYPWIGAISDTIITLNGIVATPTQMADLHTYLAAGTLTTAILDAMFGAGNYAWWKHDDRKSVALPGLATDVLAGPRAAKDWYAHEQNFRLTFDPGALPTSGYHRVRFRITDADNYWYAHLSSTPAFSVIEYVNGIPASRITGTPSGNLPVTLVVNGTVVTLYEGTSIIGTYSSASSGQDQTIGQIETIGGGTTLSGLITRPYNLSAAPLTPGAADLLAAFAQMES